MIADTALFLVVLGIISSIKTGVKADKLLSLFTFILFSFFFLFFCYRPVFSENTDFSFVWSSLPSGSIYVDIISDRANCTLLFPFLLLTLAETGKNTIFRYEERRNAYNSLLFFNLLALLMMISSNNFVQLLSGMFAVDILAFLIMHDVDNSKSYVMLNFLADMLIFTVLAVINSQVGSLEIQEISRYRQLGHHLDFTALCALTAVFIKLGFVPFQSALLPLKGIRFHRLQCVIFLTSPAAALILLQKFNMIWNFSAAFAPVLLIVCLLSAALNAVGLLLTDDIKAKAVCLQLLFLSLFVKFFQDSGFIWQEKQTQIFLSVYTLVNCVYFFYYYVNRRKKISQFAFPESAPLFPPLAGCLCFVVSASVLFPEIFPADIKSVVLNLPEKLLSVKSVVLFFTFVFFYGAAVLLHQLFAGRQQNNSGKTVLPSGKIFFWLLQAAILFLAVSRAPITLLPAVLYGSAFLFISFLPVPAFIFRCYKQEKMQFLNISADFCQKVFLAPLQFTGRILWLLVDWMFVEKLIVGTLQTSLLAFVRLFRNMHYNRVIGVLFLLLLLSGLLAAAFYQGKEM